MLYKSARLNIYIYIYIFLDTEYLRGTAINRRIKIDRFNIYDTVKYVICMGYLQRIIRHV